MICPICGERNPERARFCLACGAQLTGAQLRTRRTVTVLFCDVTDSTPLAERRDPETLRRIMSRYFEETEAVLTRHGGTVEKYIGDAVMAVFGIPRLHEDDALRALRAASELRERIDGLNDELEEAWGVRIAIRVGVNTGEVMAGDASSGHGFAAGEPVIIAQRLEAAAGPGEILLGPETYRLTRDAIQGAPLEPLTLKGKSEAVSAWRLDGIVEGAPAFERRLDAPLVDREQELSSLLEAFERTLQERTCHVYTLLGTAGIGKSRLAAELLHQVGDRATALRGRCLAYGDGITFWPLAQIVRESGGDEWIAATLAGREDAELIADRISAMLGRSTSSSGSEEIFWAVRKLFEALADQKPTVVFLEDIHWAEPTFLELIEYLAGWSRDAPLMLLCLARPELFDKQPHWLSHQPNARALKLEPLSEPDSELLLDELGLETGLSAEARLRIAGAAEGNPLFIEQMAAWAVEGGNGNGALRIPPTIHSLLAARLDRLEPAERTVIERASVIGNEFWRGAVLDLSPDDERKDVGGILLRLVRKELVRPDRSTFVHDDAFRFRHVLIRDAAYGGMPKELRADLHERFAAWIERIPGERQPEFEEIVGYHLEQAHGYVTELGGSEQRARALAPRAAERLASAGTRALARDEARAAASLLTRATVLLRHDDLVRLRLAPELGVALIEAGELAQADGVLANAVAEASAHGESSIESHARLLHLQLQLLTESKEQTAAIRGEVERLIPLLEALGDDLGLARSWYLHAHAHWAGLQATATAGALERGLEHAVRANDRREQNKLLTFLVTTIVHGPTPAAEGLRRCDEILETATKHGTVESTALRARARLLAMLGEFDDARQLMVRGRAILEELGLAVWEAASAEAAAFIELLAGEPGVAEDHLVRGCNSLEKLGDRRHLPTLTAYLGEALYQQARYDEADLSTKISEEAAPADDLGSQIVWRAVRARVRARQGEGEAAERIASEAVDIAEETDFLNLRADAFAGLSEVLRLIGSVTDADIAARHAVALYEQKGNAVSARSVERLLAANR